MGMVVHTWNASSQEAEVRSQVQGQFKVHFQKEIKLSHPIKDIIIENHCFAMMTLLLKVCYHVIRVLIRQTWEQIVLVLKMHLLCVCVTLPIIRQV